MNTIVNQVASNNPKPMSFDKKSKPKVKKTSTTKSLNTKKSLLREEVTSKLKKEVKGKSSQIEKIGL